MNIRLLTLCLLLCGSAAQLMAQPAARRTPQPDTKAATVNTRVSAREFPTAQEMPTNAAWRRDIYRSLDLNKDANATLYYPTTPQAGRVNLFTYLFKLILKGEIKAYEYTLDGNEHFDDKHQVKASKLMDTYEIYYEKEGNKIKVNDADLPSEAVKFYFVKESAYYDQHTASFRTKVTAICPVLQRGDSDFGGAELRNPMFWVNYEEAAPFLSKLMLMGSNLNNASMISADDYFTLNRYEGEIYKVTNLQDRILANYCPTDSLMKKEQRRIEKELTDFRKHVWGHDSIPVQVTEEAIADTTAQAPATSSPTRATVSRSRTATTARTSASRATTVKSSAKSTTKTSTPKSSAPRTSTKSSSPKAKPAAKPRTSASGGTMSVRRERH